MSVPNFEHIRYERPIDKVARIVMARPQVRNAQGLQMTYELNTAFDAAIDDNDVKVIILAGDDPHFSAGHDLSESGEGDHKRVGVWGDFHAGGAAGRFGYEAEVFLGMCERWRNISKPTVAQVQGKCIAGGLMLAWACDLIVASDDATFRDPTIDLGVMGVEYFVHPYEMSARQAKELLFTADWFDAQKCQALGMVNKVVARDKLEQETLELATVIASKPDFAVRAAKIAINTAQDQMGRSLTLQHSFALHQLTHAHNELKYGIPIDPNGLPPGVADKMVANFQSQAKKTPNFENGTET